jgi:C1A family cysteine protease
VNTKITVAALGATAAIAAGAIAITPTMESGLLEASDYEFMSFVSKQGRSYGTTAEFKFRSQIFKAKLQEINEFNAAGNTSTVGVNEFTDRTFAEMKKMNGYKAVAKETNVVSLDTSNLTDSVDWRTKGAVTPVKNQGQCGSCWAFSTTGSVEGAMFLSTGTLQSFSEQQLMDCSGSFGNMSCNGGLMDNAFKYIESVSGLESEANYGYTARDGTCSFVSTKGVGKVASYTDVPTNSPAQLKAAIAKAPVSVAIEADQMAFQGYTSGVITSGCGQQLDHGVLAVGYGTLGGEEFFLVKNSWGASWGDAGYVRIGAGSSNVCGILSAASYPTE